MLEALIVILFVLWLFGYFGRGYWRIPRSGPAAGAPVAGWMSSANWIHILLLIVVVLVVLRLIG